MADSTNFEFELFFIKYRFDTLANLWFSHAHTLNLKALQYKIQMIYKCSCFVSIWDKTRTASQWICLFFRPLLSHAVPSSAPATTVQITIQPPKSVGDMGPRPMLTQPGKPLSQPLVQAAHLASQQHKVIMSQATVSPIIHPQSASSTTKLSKYHAPANVKPMLSTVYCMNRWA